MKRLSPLLLLLLLLPACGYHLAAGGGGPVPEVVKTLAVVSHATSKSHAAELRKIMQETSLPYLLVDDPDSAEGILRLSPIQEAFHEVGFDASGIATSYRLSMSGTLQLESGGRTVWQSGEIVVREDVFAVGDPENIESMRLRVRKNLIRQWAEKAWRVFASGF